MAHEIQPVREVSKNYGVRTIGQGASMDKSINSDRRFTVTLTGALLAEIVAGGDFTALVDIPATHVVKNSYLVVKEAFVLGGTTPAVVVGEGANTVTLDEAELESVGYVAAPTAAGLLASGTYVTADVALGLAVTGTDVTVDPTVGDATLVIETTSI